VTNNLSDVQVREHVCMIIIQYNDSHEQRGCVAEVLAEMLPDAKLSHQKTMISYLTFPAAHYHWSQIGGFAVWHVAHSFEENTSAGLDWLNEQVGIEVPHYC